MTEREICFVMASSGCGGGFQVPTRKKSKKISAKFQKISAKLAFGFLR